MIPSHHVYLTILWLAMSLLPTSVFAQGAAGSVTGVITDQTGAAVPAATAILHNRDTGQNYTTTSTGSGAFTFPSIRIGAYDLTVSASGFQTTRTEALRIETATATRVDVELKVGSTAESLSVTADLPLLQSDSSSVGTVVNRSLLDKVPFQLTGTNRDVTSFIRMVPGVNSAGNFSIAITGGRVHATEVLVDGVTNTYRGAVNEPFSVRPSMTSVSEFRVETAVPPAEYGRTSSGVIIITTKSGTNELHGNFEFLMRNNVLDSRRFNARVADITRQGEGSISLGGPVVLPKLYNGRNRTFFFTDFMVFRRINQPQGVTRTIATNAMRGGDFSGSGSTVYDPLTGSAGQGRVPFAGNTIPTNRISAFARAMLGVIPPPNLPALANNYLGSSNNIENMRSFMMRLEHRFSDRHGVTLIGRPTWNERNNYNGPWGPSRLEGYYDLPYAPHINMQDDFIIRPNLLNKFTVGYTNWFSLFLQTPFIEYQVPNAFGPGFPVVQFSGQGLSTIGENVDRTVGSNTINIQDAVSWTTGRHSFKFGFRYDWMEDNTQTLGNQNGTYQFAPFTTGVSGSASGHSFASLLLGAPASAAMQFGLPLLARSQALGFFAQDDWKVTNRLTVNYGLRYEIQQPWFDRDGNASSLDLTMPNPAAGNLPGAMIFAGEGAGRQGVRSLVKNYYGAWGPRLGMAYQVTPSTVLRVGAGVFYAPRRLANVRTEGFSSNISLASLDGGYTPTFYLDQGWPAGVPVKPPFISPTLVNGRAAAYVDPDSNTGAGRMARTYQTQISVQQSIRSAVVELGWISTQARHLPNATLENLNQLDPRHLALGDLLRRNITDPLVAAQGFRAPYAGFQGTLAQALRPFPQFQGITSVDSPSGNSNFHALVVKYEQRFTSGIAVLTSYTFSKFLSDVEIAPGGTTLLQNSFDRRSERSVASIDIPHRFIGSIAYDLPFGRGKAWLSKGIIGHLAGGFSLSGIFAYESGAPLRITIPNGLPIFNGQLRPDLVGGVDPFLNRNHGSFRPLNGLTGETGDLMLNRAAFTTPRAYSFGNLAPFLSSVRAFGFGTEDISLAKRNYISERQFIEFRTDWFNAPNRMQLTSPVTDLTNANFGRITGQRSARVIQLGIRYGF